MKKKLNHYVTKHNHDDIQCTKIGSVQQGTTEDGQKHKDKIISLLHSKVKRIETKSMYSCSMLCDYKCYESICSIYNTIVIVLCINDHSIYLYQNVFVILHIDLVF